ncbi:MAG: ABC transporter permease [Cellulomonadaceae bacterium]
MRRVAHWTAWAVAAGLPLAFLAVFFAWPVATLVLRGFQAEGTDLPPWLPGAWDLSGFAEVLARPRTLRIVGLTLAQATLGTALSVVLGLPGAYVLYRCRFPLRGLVRALVVVPFVLPTVVVGVAFRSLIAENGPLGALGLDGSFPAIVAALVFFNYAVVVRTVGGFWAQLDPRPEEAARALGAGPLRVLWTVTLPALGPAIASAAALVFLFCATAFGTVLILGGARYGTIETEIYLRTTQFLDLRSASVLSVLQLLIVALALLVSARARSSRERALSLTGPATGARRLRLRDLRGGTGAAAAVTALVVGVLLTWPMLNLALRSLRTADGTWTLRNYRALGAPGPEAGLSVSVWEAAATSLRTAALAAALAVTVGGLIAFLVSRRPATRSGRRALSVLDAVFMVPLGVSAVTVGFGFLITLDRPLGLDVDLRTAGLLVPVAQAVVAIPIVVRTVLPVLRAIDPRLRQAAATLGAGPARVLATVDGPLMARALGLAIGFAFAVSLGEFGATSFLARPDSATLPVVIFRLIGRPGPDNYGMALAASVVLAVLTASVMLVTEKLRGDRGGEI